MDTNNIKNRLTYIQIIKELLPYLWVKEWRIKIRIIISAFFTILRILASLAVLIIFKKIINLFSQTNINDFETVYFWLFLYGFLWTLSAIFNQFKTYIMFRVLEHGEHLLGIRIFDHLQSLSLRFHLEKRTGAITNAIHHAQSGFDGIFWGLLLFVIPTILEMLMALSLLFYLYGFFYSFILILILIVYFIFTIIGIEWSAKFQRVYIEKKNQAYSRIVDSLLNFETIKYFDNEKYESVQCDKILKELEDAGVSKYTKEDIVIMGQWIVVGIGLILLTLVSGKAVLNGKLTVGDFALINSYVLQFAAPLNHFGYIMRQIRKGFTDMEQYILLLHKKPEVVDVLHAKPLKIDGANIVFEDVTFSYNPSRIILKNVSFSVPAGKTIAIVGATGSGKSTISRLLFRFYDTTSGKILINNQDISKVTQESLHESIGIVPQDTVLFNNTIYYNIAYGKPGATSQEIENAARLAHLDSFLKIIPKGYNTLVGERGLKLSGGEKQRIAIARVVLKQPKIYIFDEATSALDTYTEREIQKNLNEISKGSTTLIIAHRLSTIIHADEILVFENGQIIERGNHYALLDKNGIYAQLWKKQQQLEKK